MKCILDNIRSSYNVGSLLRSCDGVGADAILVGYTPQPRGSTYPLISKTAIGAQESVEYAVFDTYQQVLHAYPQSDTCIHMGIEISACSRLLYSIPSDTDLYNRLIQCETVCVWLGNEIHGLPAQLEAEIEGFFHLPMRGIKESLNVSSCGTAALYLMDMMLRS